MEKLNFDELVNYTGGVLCWTKIMEIVDYITLQGHIDQARAIIDGCATGQIQYNANC